MLYVTFFFTVTLILFALLLKLKKSTPQTKRHPAAARPPETGPHPEFRNQARVPACRRWMEPLWDVMNRQFRRKMHGDKADRIELKLMQAGSPLGMTPIVFRLLQISLLVAVPLLFVIYAIILGLSLGGILIFVLLGMGAAAFLPSYYLKLKTGQKRKAALKELPDVLDLLTVSLEAGLGFDAALNKLVSKKDGVLSGEFQRCLEEIRLGKTRRDALAGVRDRVDLNELKVTISSILQADKLGIGMAQVLRVQSQEVRERRKQTAEEEAMKAPIKMLFPLVLFIFPSLFIVLLGPAVIQFILTFSK
jgi:tight adherence protein C